MWYLRAFIASPTREVGCRTQGLSLFTATLSSSLAPPIRSTKDFGLLVTFELRGGHFSHAFACRVSEDGPGRTAAAADRTVE